MKRLPLPLCPDLRQLAAADAEPAPARPTLAGLKNRNMRGRRRLDARCAQLDAARDVCRAQLLDCAVHTRHAVQECARWQLRGEVERAKEHVVPLERAEEVDGLDGVVLAQHGRAEGGVLIPFGEGVGEEGVHTLGGFVEDLGHVVLVGQPRGGGDVGELSVTSPGEIAMDGSGQSSRDSELGEVEYVLESIVYDA